MTDNAAPANNSIDDFPHKIFAGNLSFKTTEDELKEFFSAAGSVVKVNIITRGTRSLGYGFVAFSSIEECHAAVEKLNKQELGGRPINIEVAKPKSELDAVKKEKAAARASKPRTKARRPRVRKPSNKEGEEKKADEDDSTEKKTGKSRPRQRKRSGKAPPKEREPRVKREPTGEPSKTTVFVANLPFSLNDETFALVFSEYKVKTAKVVVRRGTGRSKGFGFVELENEEEQQRLLNAAAGFVSEGRELNIKVALSEEKTAEAEAEATKEEA